VLLGVLLLLSLGSRVWERVQEDQAREPLQAAAKASYAEGSPIGLLSPSRAARWTQDSPGPSEEAARAVARPGNVYLAPAFYYSFARHGESPTLAPVAGSRCYYFPVQRGAEFDPARVSAVVRICYTDESLTPYEWASTAVG
jgi:hypothetical protein